MEMADVFGGGASVDLEKEAPVEVATDKNAAKKQKDAAMKDCMTSRLNSDPEYRDKLRCMSASLKVINVLGFSKGSNMILDKEATAREGKRVLISDISANIGYRVMNVGTEPIQYQTAEYKQDATGIFVAEKVTKTLAPGEVVDLEKSYLTRLTARPEFSFTLANGIMKPSSKKKITCVEDQLQSFYFAFTADENGETANVNDDRIKLTIDVDGVVKPEFQSVFGYLNNPKVKKENNSKLSKGSGITKQDIFANYVFTLLEQQGEV